ncbi:MAG: hypothetical protein JST84_00050 [Acidobacteria bacterium]|nr:hypothetical protein [Acidobacteriota bacterium]
MAKKVGICRICTLTKALSKEHIPPRNAYNSEDVILSKPDLQSFDPFVNWKKRIIQGGYSEFVICESCNNQTGTWYGREYGTFASSCVSTANESNLKKTVPIVIPKLMPLRVYKQALTTICASAKPDFSRRLDLVVGKNPNDWGVIKPKEAKDLSLISKTLPDIQKFILDKTANKPAFSVRLFTYLVAEESRGRMSGYSKQGSKSTGKLETIAEFARWPVGWVLVFDGEPKPPLCEVSGWSNYEYDETATISLNIPCYSIKSAVPLDFGRLS